MYWFNYRKLLSVTPGVIEFLSNAIGPIERNYWSRNLQPILTGTVKQSSNSTFNRNDCRFMEFQIKGHNPFRTANPFSWKSPFIIRRTNSIGHSYYVLIDTTRRINFCQINALTEQTETISPPLRIQSLDVCSKNSRQNEFQSRERLFGSKDENVCAWKAQWVVEGIPNGEINSSNQQEPEQWWYLIPPHYGGKSLSN